MCNNLYLMLLQHFDNTSKLSKEEKQERELEACRYSIKFLIPEIEKRIYECNEEFMPKYYELWEKAYAFAGRRSLEHFIDYIELDLPAQSKVLANRRNVLKPFIFYLNKSAFDSKLQYIEASFPPRIW
ncbi:MAG: hypothetical protein E7310_06465 [Clostridiales bacterium]|nr:hypothetical protein [Clostridiales bacterium]